jgi:hypothetical protein
MPTPPTRHGMGQVYLYNKVAIINTVLSCFRYYIFNDTVSSADAIYPRM